jgi:hypothetical protein
MVIINNQYAIKFQLGIIILKICNIDENMQKQMTCGNMLMDLPLAFVAFMHLCLFSRNSFTN